MGQVSEAKMSDRKTVAHHVQYVATGGPWEAVVAWDDGLVEIRSVISWKHDVYGSGISEDVTPVVADVSGSMDVGDQICVLAAWPIELDHESKVERLAWGMDVCKHETPEKIAPARIHPRLAPLWEEALAANGMNRWAFMFSETAVEVLARVKGA